VRILVVDDSALVRRNIRGILSQLGHTAVDEASNGIEALSIAVDYHPGLVIVDWNMPTMDGISFTRRFREAGFDAPVLLVTTQTSRSAAIEAVKAGVDSIVIKPFSPDLLSQRIEDVLATPATLAI